MQLPSPKTSIKTPTSRTPGGSSNTITCPRHPRSWVEKKVFFVTKTRVCPYCELESFTPGVDPYHVETLPPPEPSFGGFATPQPRRKSRGAGHRRRPSNSSPGTPQPQTPRTPRTPRTPGGGRVHTFTPTRGQPQTPGSTTAARRSTVFNSSRSENFTVDGRPPRPADAPSPLRRRSSHNSTARSNQASAATHTRRASCSDGVDSATSLAPTHTRRASNSDSASSGTSCKPPRPSTPGAAADGGDVGGAGADAKAIPPQINPAAVESERSPKSSPPTTAVAPSPLAVAADGGANGALPPRPKNPTIGASPARMGRSLMFTSAARKRGNGNTPSSRGGGGWSNAASPQPSTAHDVPPSPAGSVVSCFSDMNGGGGGRPQMATTPRSGTARGPAEVTVSLPSPGACRHSVDAGDTVESTLNASSEAGVGAVSKPGVALGVGQADAPADVTLKLGSGGGECSTSPALAVAEAALASVEATEPAIKNLMQPAAAATVKLAAAVEALRSETVMESASAGGGGGGGGGIAEHILSAAFDASTAVKHAERLSREEGEGGYDGAGHNVEAADAILTEAGLAVEKLAQIARAFVWSGNTATIGESKTFAERCEQASAAVSEAAQRTEAFLANELAPRNKAPREAAAAQRKWMAILDRQEAWSMRSASRAGLLTAEQEIPADSVAVFRDCGVSGERVFGPIYAGEYLGKAVSVSVLDRPVGVSGGKSAAARLRATATEEIRALVGQLPRHPRLARTHGVEIVSTSVPANLRSAPLGATAAPPLLVLVGELVESGSLRARVANAKAKAGQAAVSGSVGSLRWRRILADVAEGLACLHGKGVEHGALSSENILVDAGGRAKLSLYGLTRTRRALAALMTAGDAEAAADSYEQGNLAASMCPTAFMPPEVLRPSDPEEERGAVPRKLGATDTYAFGMIAWEVVTGQQPWAGLTKDEMVQRVLSHARPELASEAAGAAALDGLERFPDLLAALWAHDPADRPAMQDVVRKLRVPELTAAKLERPLPRVLPSMEQAGQSSYSSVAGGKEGGAAALPVEAGRQVLNAKAVGRKLTDAGDDDGSALRSPQQALAATDSVARGVEGDEAGCPRSDGAAGGSATPAGGGGGGTLVVPEGVKDSADALCVERAGLSQSEVAPEGERDRSAAVVDGGGVDSRGVRMADGQAEVNANADENENVDVVANAPAAPDSDAGELTANGRTSAVMDETPKPIGTVPISPLVSESKFAQQAGEPEPQPQPQPQYNPKIEEARDCEAPPVAPTAPTAAATPDAGAGDDVPGRMRVVSYGHSSLAPLAARSGDSESEDDGGHSPGDSGRWTGSSSPFPATRAAAGASDTPEAAAADAAEDEAVNISTKMGGVIAAAMMSMRATPKTGTKSVDRVTSESSSKIRLLRPPTKQQRALRKNMTALPSLSTGSSVSRMSVESALVTTPQSSRYENGTTAAAASQAMQLSTPQPMEAVDGTKPTGKGSPDTPSRGQRRGLAARVQGTPRRARSAFRGMATSVIRFGKRRGEVDGVNAEES